MTEVFGKMGAERGERCTNPGCDDRFTTPCCYADVDQDASECPDCGAPIECEVEYQPVAVCRDEARAALAVLSDAAIRAQGGVRG